MISHGLRFVLLAGPVVLFFISVAYSLFNHNGPKELFVYGSYYIVTAMVILWGYYLIELLKDQGFSFNRFINRYWIGILVALLMATTVFLSTHVRFKTLSDETNLLAVSKSMLLSKTPYLTTMEDIIYGKYTRYKNAVPKRPLIYPYLTHLLHLVNGYDYRHPYVINFCALFAFLLGVYVVTCRNIGKLSAVATMFCVIAYPVVTVFSTSACYDFFSMAFLGLVLVSLYRFLKAPSAPQLAFLWSNLIVYTNVRTENFAYFFITAVGLIVLKKIKWSYIKEAALLYCATPLLLTPYFLQHILKAGHQTNNQDVALFSLGAFSKNFMVLVNHFLDFRFYLPYATLLNLAGLVLIVFFIVQFLRKKIVLAPFQKIFLLFFTALISFNFVLSLAHFAGEYIHPSTQRHYIVFSMLFAFAPAVYRYYYPKNIPGTKYLLCAVLLFCIYHPVAVQENSIKTLTQNRKTYKYIDFLETRRGEDIIVVNDRPGQIIAIDIPAVNFTWAKTNKRKLLDRLDRGFYSDIIVLQDVAVRTSTPEEGEVLPSDFKLFTLKEVQYKSDTSLRISKVLRDSNRRYMSR